MKNPLTFQIESSLGAVFVSLLSMFFIGLIFIAVKNFETDTDIETMLMTTENNKKPRTISATELVMMQEWIQENNVEIPDGMGYRYLTRKYPSKPWISD